MLNYALGIIEVQGYSVALAVADSACKAANVKLAAMDCNAPALGDKANIPLMVQIKLTGTIDDVQAALEVAKRKALNYNEEKDILTHIITRPYEDLQKLINVGKVKIK